MCGTKRKYNVGYEQSHYSQSRKSWHLSWLPFTLLLFFVFNLHSWGFVFQSWMWFLVPIACVMISSCFTKTHGAPMFNAEKRTSEIPLQTEQPYVQLNQQVSYYNPAHETYSEEGQDFRYPQQIRYEEPYVDYPQPIHPKE